MSYFFFPCFLRFLFAYTACLPLSLLHALGAGLGRCVYWWSRSYRQSFERNLAQAGFFDACMTQRAAAEAGKGVVELAYVWFRPTTQLMARVRSANWQVIEQARALGKGIIFLTPHLGCFEITASYYASNPADGAPLTVLYRPPRKAWLTRLVEQQRSRPNLHLARTDLGGVRRLIRALQRGEAIGLLPDQVPHNGEGVWAPFFGRPAYTMTLPAKLHAASGAPLVLAYGERLAHGAGWVVHIEAFEQSLTGSLASQAALINAAMENLIARCPAQYWWGYDRYKAPKHSGDAQQ